MIGICRNADSNSCTVTCIMIARVQRLPLLRLPRLRAKVRRIRRRVTCITIVTKVRLLYATKKLRQDGLSHCAQPRTGRRVVEYSHYSGRPARIYALRSVSEEPEHRAQHADATLERFGRCRSFGAPALQRTAAALRIHSDWRWARFSPGYRGNVCLG